MNSPSVKHPDGVTLLLFFCCCSSPDLEKPLCMAQKTYHACKLVLVLVLLPLILIECKGRSMQDILPSVVNLLGVRSLAKYEQCE